MTLLWIIRFSTSEKVSFFTEKRDEINEPIRNNNQPHLYAPSSPPRDPGEKL